MVVEVAPILDIIVKYGVVGVLVLVVLVFLRTEVLPKGTHQEIIDLWKERVADADKRCSDVVAENDRLWRIALTTGQQATQATALAEKTVLTRRGAGQPPGGNGG